MKQIRQIIAKKVFLTAVFFLVMFFSMYFTVLQTRILATSEDGTDWEYQVTDNTVTITGYIGASSDVEVPSEIEGKSVTAIADGAIAGNPIVVSITVPEGVVSIGEEAFADCPYLESVILPESVTSIGRRAFRYCYSLETVTLPSDLSEFPYQGFWDCESLKEIVIPNGVEVIPNGAFYDCMSLKSVVVPESVTAIEKNAFHACLRLENIDLSENVTNIDDSAFSDCEYLVINAPEGCAADQFAKAGGYVPENVVLESEHPYYEDEYWEYTYPGDAAALKVTFSPKTYVYGLFGMDEIIIKDKEENEFCYSGYELSGKTLVIVGNYFSVEIYGFALGTDFGFRITGVEPMNETEYRDYIDELNEHPWESRVVNGTLEITGYRGTLGEVTLPASINGIHVVSIASKAFLKNIYLTNLTIESGVTKIGDSAFERCVNLESISIPETVTEIGEYAFYGCESLSELVFPDNLTELSDNVAMYCASLSSVTLPSHLTTIGEGAFNQCESLTEISIPETVTQIKADAFSKSGLLRITIPNGITVIPRKFCSECSDLETVDFPDNLTEIEAYAFMSCKSLAEISLPETVTILGSGCFSGTGITEIKLPEGLVSIGGNAFSNTHLTSFYVPASVTELGDTVVYYCNELTELTVDPDNPNYKSENNMIFNKAGDTLVECAHGLSGEIIIPEGTVTILKNACATMVNMTSIVLPDSLTELEASAFYLCTSLVRIEIPEGITVLPDALFSRCDSLREVVIPESVTEIGKTAFSYCPALKTIALPSGLLLLGSGVFMYSGLESAVVPDSVETIESYAFGFCDALKTVALPDSIENMDKTAFYRSPNVAVFASAGSDSFEWAKNNMIIAVDPPTAVEGLIYTGSPVSLITGGTVSKGTLLFAVNTEKDEIPAADEYTESLPTASRAGTYYVWFKVVADDNHNGSEPACVEVTIAPDYTVKEVTGLSGNGEDEWTKGGEDGVVITVKDSGEDNSFDHFTGVKLDGKLLTKDVDYTAKKGTTIVTLLPATLEKLSVGEHTVTVLFDNGEVNTNLTIKAANSGNVTSPETGDNSHMDLWIAIMIIALCALVAMLFIGKKKRVFDR